MRYLAVDPGDARIGIALSDALGKIARPFTILKHASRQEDAKAIASIAVEHNVTAIIVGQALDVENRPTLQSRKAKRLAAAIREVSGLVVNMWDESGSSQMAQNSVLSMNVKNRKNREMDDIAAAFILQNYIDAQNDY